MPARSRNAAARTPSPAGYRQIASPGAGGAQDLARGARRSALLPAPRRLRVTSPKNAHGSISRRACPVRRRAACANPAVRRACRPRAGTGGDHGRFPSACQAAAAPAGRPGFSPYIIGPGALPRYRYLPAPRHHPCAPCASPIDEPVRAATSGPTSRSNLHGGRGSDQATGLGQHYRRAVAEAATLRQRARRPARGRARSRPPPAAPPSAPGARLG